MRLKALFNVCQCFAEGTSVRTPDGEKGIEQLQPGDYVLSDDPRTPGGIKAEQVLGTFMREANSVIDLRIGDRVITTTDDHPFWVPGQGWVEAKDLQVGMPLQTDRETFVGIDGIERREGSFQVYNLDIAGFDTFFVSDLDLLVHNECGPNRLGSRGPSVPPNKAVKVDAYPEGLSPSGSPMTPEQARNYIDRTGNDVFAGSRDTARNIAGRGAVGPETHPSGASPRFPHFHRASKSNPRFGGRGRRRGHVFFPVGG